MLSSGYYIAGLLAVLSVGLVVAEGRLVERFIWNELQFDWPSAEVKEAALSSEQVSDWFSRKWIVILFSFLIKLTNHDTFVTFLKRMAYSFIAVCAQT